MIVIVTQLCNVIVIMIDYIKKFCNHIHNCNHGILK